MLEKESMPKNHFEEVYRLAAEIRLKQKRKYEESKIMVKEKNEKRAKRKSGYFS